MSKPKLIRILNDENVRPQKYAVFGYYLGTYSDYRKYIIGYTEAIKKVYQRFAESGIYEKNIHDTIVYPFCFLCRQAIELCIKYLYHRYTRIDKDRYIKFLNKSGHHLLSAWKTAAPALQKLIDRFPSCGFDMKWFEECIAEMDGFDDDSFKMRYPINKKMERTIDKRILLDVDFLEKGIIELLNQFMNLDYFFDNVLVNNEYSEKFWLRFKSEYYKSQCLVNRIIEITEKAVKEEEKLEEQKFVSQFEEHTAVIPVDSLEIESLIRDADMNQLVTVMILLYTGRDLVDERFKLSETASERAKDLIAGLECTVSEVFDLNYDDPETDRWDLCSKLQDARSDCIYSWMTTIRAYCDEIFISMAEKDEAN